MSFFDSHHGLFSLILPYFAFSLPFYFPFSHFLSPFFLFLFPFFLFLLRFPPFSLHLFIFFPPNDIGWYFFPSPGGGGGIFQYIGPCIILNLESNEWGIIDVAGLSRLFITRIDEEYHCDVFFPPWGPDWVRVGDPRVPEAIQVLENNIFILTVHYWMAVSVVWGTYLVQNALQNS